MNGQDEITSKETSVKGSCRQEGCTCQDARIVSFRRAGFFAVVARKNGETADRTIAPEAGWRIPADEAPTVEAPAD
jgi:hypothetical protein